ncbi:dystrobrevin binding protein 1 [Willisornis vidua]|uniref:Dystrobrevin binding protein 1 n=1 Tax=Willisornis vidua TaxID=1566151 RepID=A0ABQ9DR13_9PASS|nr:dystrobrevin binding protein 1 [Willisornis vidua]
MASPAVPREEEEEEEEELRPPCSESGCGHEEEGGTNRQTEPAVLGGDGTGLVDSEVVMLSAHWEKKRNSLVELQDQLQQIPGFLADLECLTASLAQLEADFEEMETHLLCLEELCEQWELHRYKSRQTLQLENYKKTKRKELETFKAELDADHAQKVLDMEHTQQLKLKERQKFFEEAFQQDMEQYLSTGYLQIAERRGKFSDSSCVILKLTVLRGRLSRGSMLTASKFFLSGAGTPDKCLNKLSVPGEVDTVED